MADTWHTSFCFLRPLLHITPSEVLSLIINGSFDSTMNPASSKRIGSCVSRSRRGWFIWRPWRDGERVEPLVSVSECSRRCKVIAYSLLLSQRRRCFATKSTQTDEPCKPSILVIPCEWLSLPVQRNLWFWARCHPDRKVIPRFCTTNDIRYWFCLELRGEIWRRERSV